MYRTALSGPTMHCSHRLTTAARRVRCRRTGHGGNPHALRARDSTYAGGSLRLARALSGLNPLARPQQSAMPEPGARRGLCPGV